MERGKIEMPKQDQMIKLFFAVSIGVNMALGYLWYQNEKYIVAIEPSVHRCTAHTKACVNAIRNINACETANKALVKVLEQFKGA